MQRVLSTVTLLGLLVATAAAFAVTERLKLVKSPITGPHLSKFFSPTCGCARGRANISVKLRRSDRVTLTVLDSHRDVVRTVASRLRVPRGRSVFHWDGTTDAGARAPDGSYQVQIHLQAQHRTILLPNRIELDTSPPTVEAAVPNRPRFSPDGDHRADTVSIHYRLSKPAHALVYLNGQRIIRSRAHTIRGAVEWAGRLEGSALRPGPVTLEVGGIDLAGNATPPAQRAQVRVEIRYISLALARVSVPRGRPFELRVSTDAARYGWKLGAAGGVASGPVLRLRAPRTRGRYTLTLSEHGHMARGVVVVR